MSIDVKIRGSEFRLITTHLDGDCLPITTAFQRAQGQELLAGPAQTVLPLVLVGDLNSPADGTGVTYNDLLGSGFSDAWDAGGIGEGLTCCQADDLLNETSMLNRRIDFVLLRGPIATVMAVLTGATEGMQTPSGLGHPITPASPPC